MGFTDTMLRDSSWCGRVCGQEHQFIISDPAVNMWTTEITLELTEDLHSTLYVCGTPSPSAYKDRNKKSDVMASLAVKYSVTVEELDKKLHTLKSLFRRKHKKLTVSNKSGMSPKKVCLVRLRATHVCVTSNRVKRLQKHGH